MEIELFYSRGSPFSLRMVWSINLINSKIFEDIKSTGSVSSTKLIKRTLEAKVYKEEDKENKTVSLPILFYKNQENEEVVIRDGFEIVHFFSEMHKDSSEFAQCFLEEYENMQEWNSSTSKIGRYFRRYITEVGNDAGKYFAPKFVTYIPYLTEHLTQQTLDRLSKKYGEEDKKISLEEVEDTLEKANKIFEECDYLVSNVLSFADVSLCTMIELHCPTFDERPITSGSLSQKHINRQRKLKWKEKFPFVFTAKDRIFEENLDEVTIEKSKMKVKRKIVFEEDKP